MRFESVKVFDGYSTCFRQWRANGTHCQFLHGYGVKFKITFEGVLDFRNWVADFGMMRRTGVRIRGMSPKEYFSWLFDHTTVIAKDDPAIDMFKTLHESKLIQLRFADKVGCERFAEHILLVADFVAKKETDGRVRVKCVEFMENEKNSAIAFRVDDSKNR